MDDESWDAVINMNLRSTFIVTREVCNRAMIPQHYGKIINLSSMKSVLGTALDGVTPLMRLPRVLSAC